MKALGRGSHGNVYSMDDFLMHQKDEMLLNLFLHKERPRLNQTKESLIELLHPLHPNAFIVKELDHATFLEEKEYNSLAFGILGNNYSLLHQVIGFTLSGKDYICNLKGKNALDSASFTVTKMKSYCHDILEGLQLLSNHGYSHNDVKLENTLYHPIKKRYVLIDFGKLNKATKFQLDNICGFNRDYRLFDRLSHRQTIRNTALKLCLYRTRVGSEKKSKRIGKQWYIEVYKKPFWQVWEQHRLSNYHSFVSMLDGDASSLTLKKLLKYSDLYMMGVSIIYILTLYQSKMTRQSYTFFTHLALALTTELEYTLHDLNHKPFLYMISLVSKKSFEALPKEFQYFYNESKGSKGSKGTKGTRRK
jgi:serine/threonine protein kinase